MQFGIWTPLPHTIRPEPGMTHAVERLRSGDVPVGERDPAFTFACDIIRRADALGFDITLVAQRYLGPDLEAFTLASALAMVTSRIELMVAVHPGMASPQIVAKMAASLDRISGGRAALNVVNGWWEEEFKLFSNGNWIGAPEQRYARMREFIQVMKGLWTNPDLRAEGKHYRAYVQDALKGSKGKVDAAETGEIVARTIRGSLPIYAASSAPQGRQTIAAHGDVWFADCQPGHRNFEANLARLQSDLREMDGLAASFGRTLRYAINPQVICCESQAQAEALADVIEAPTGGRVSNALGAGLVGTPELIAQRLRRLEEIGIACVMLRFSPMMEGVETFGTQVIPLMRK